MIERICQQCGNHFFAYPYQISGKNRHKAIFCSAECRVKAMIGTHQSEEASRKKSEALSRKIKTVCKWCGKEFFVKPCVLKIGSGKFCSRQCYGLFQQSQNWNWWRKGKAQTEETRRKIALARLGSHASDEAKRKMSINRKGKIPYKAIEAVRAKWQDAEWRQRQVEAISRSCTKKPNKPELKLQAILDKYFPDEWQYTGDGFHIIGGFAPDFTNCNGKKQLIELFGDYWHSSLASPDWHQTELGKIMSYNSLGYRCLIIWEHELKDLTEQQIAKKIKACFRRKRYAHTANV